MKKHERRKNAGGKADEATQCTGRKKKRQKNREVNGENHADAGRDINSTRTNQESQITYARKETPTNGQRENTQIDGRSTRMNTDNDKRKQATQTTAEEG